MDKSILRPCVLIIDDSPLELRALSMVLSVMYDVKIANSAKVGLEILDQHEVDLIVLDLYMPEMSGFEMLCLLKDTEKTAHIPVIIASSSESSNDEVRGLSLGAHDFVRKPFVDAVINFRIARCLQMISQMKIIEKFGLIDELTGLNNRRSFYQTIKCEWARAMRTQEPLGMLMVDLDRFKQFNDDYGHFNGDTCLKTVAEVMVNSVMRGNDYVFRWGGEEFAIILPCTPLEGALAVAERIRKNIASTDIVCDDITTSITASIGVGAAIPSQLCDKSKSVKNLDEFCIDVDKALYQAKARGRNRVETLQLQYNT